MYDVIIIGAGVSGAAAARELSRWHLKICVLEREEDVCCGTSKANSGIVHAGFDAPPGTLMAKLNVRGSELMGKLSEELDFPFRRTGSLVVCRDIRDIPRLEELKTRGETNGAVRAFGAAGSEWSAVCIDEGVYRFRRGYGGGTSGRMRPASSGLYVLSDSILVLLKTQRQMVWNFVLTPGSPGFKRSAAAGRFLQTTENIRPGSWSMQRAFMLTGSTIW